MTFDCYGEQWSRLQKNWRKIVKGSIDDCGRTDNWMLINRSDEGPGKITHTCTFTPTYMYVYMYYCVFACKVTEY